MKQGNIAPLTRECADCGGAKTVSVSLRSFCNDCGLDPLDLKYEVPAEKVEKILLDIFTILQEKGLKPVKEQLNVPSFDELMKRLKS